MKKAQTQTVYLAFEVVAINEGKASARALDILHDLHKNGSIGEYEILATDSHPLKETKKIIAPVLFEIFKIKDLSTTTINSLKPLLTWFGENFYKNKSKT